MKGISSGLSHFTACLEDSSKEKEDYYRDGSIALLRSYWTDFVAPIEMLPEYCSRELLTLLHYGPHAYPLYVLQCEQSPENPWIWLSGVVHGDEDAGGKAILEFVRDDIEAYLSDFNFLMVPCVNPSGYEALSLQSINGYHSFMREHKNDGNLNRLFGTASKQQEVMALEGLLVREERSFLLAMDLHESAPYYTDETYTALDAPRGCWLYETCGKDVSSFGNALLASLPDTYEVCSASVIYDDSAERGVITEITGHQELGDMTSLDGYIFTRYASHSFTTETPTGWRLEDRIIVQRHLINEAVKQYRLMKK